MSSLISDPRVVIADEFHYGATYYKANLDKAGLLDYVKLALNEVSHVLTDETRDEVLVDVVAENAVTVKMQEIHISEDLT